MISLICIIAVLLVLALIVFVVIVRLQQTTSSNEFPKWKEEAVNECDRLIKCYDDDLHKKIYAYCKKENIKYIDKELVIRAVNEIVDDTITYKRMRDPKTSVAFDLADAIIKEQNKNKE